MRQQLNLPLNKILIFLKFANFFLKCLNHESKIKKVSHEKVIDLKGIFDPREFLCTYRDTFFVFGPRKSGLEFIPSE